MRPRLGTIGGPPARARDALRELAVVVGYCAFGVYATWPLAPHMFTSFSDVGDPYSNAWNLWWMKEQLVALENPWFSDHIIAPVGSYLAYHAFVPIAGIVMAPVTAIFGAAVALNLLKLAVPVLNSYVTYRLALRLGLSRPVAVVTGALYGFSTMLAWRADYHLNFSVGSLFAPLALLCAVRYRQLGRPRDAALLGAALGAALLADQTAALFAGLLAIGYLAAIHVRGRIHPRRWLKPLAIAAATGLLVATPQLAMTLRQQAADTAVSDVALVAPSWKAYNASLHAMASPSPRLRLETPWDLKGMLYRTEIGEAVPAFGWAVLGLALCALLLATRRLLVMGLAAAFAAAVILALGPELTVSKTPHVPLPETRHGQELSGLMPYTWLVELPGLGQLRVAARFALLGLLPAVLLAGIGLEALVRRGRWAYALAGLLVALAALEAGWPMTRNERQVPLTRDALYAPVKADRSDSIVVDVPLGFIGGSRVIGDPSPQEGLLRATEHEHRIATGFLSRLPQNRSDALIAHRFFTDVIVQQRLDQPQQGFPAPDPRVGGVDAASMGVGWVVVWPQATREVRGYVRATGFRLLRRVDGIELYGRDRTSGRVP